MDKSSKYWDRVSGWSKAESAANSTLVSYLKSKLGAYMMPNDTVLDFGCGTGTITLRIANTAKKVFGVDASNGMLRRAQQNLEKHNVSNVVFSKITVLDEMFQDESFEIITSFNVFQYIEDRKELFELFYKLLKPQGKLIIALPCFGSANSLTTRFVKLLRFMRIMPKTYFFRIDEIEKEIADTGLTIIESTNLSNLPEKFIVAKK